MTDLNAKRNDWLLKAENVHISLEKWQNIINLMGEICDTPAAFIVQHTDNGYQVVIASETKQNPYNPGGVIPVDTNIFCRRVVIENRYLYENSATTKPEWESNPEVANDKFNTYLGAPIHWPDGSLFGTCCVMDFAKTDFQQKYIDLVHEFSRIIENDLILAEQYSKLEQLSLTDELTGLYNRRGFLTLAPEKINLAKRYNQGFAVIYCDIDKLKPINDQHGHYVGDQVIKAGANLVRNSIRASDLAARIGGDEFVIMSFMDKHDEIEQITNRLKDIFEVDSEPKLHMHMSLGKEYYSSDAEYNLKDIIKRADELMYLDKRSKK